MHLKLLCGNPGRRPINRNELQPEETTSEPPRGLHGEGKTIWKLIAPQLCELRILTVLDRHHLARSCRLEALGMKLLRKAEKKPVVATKANGRQPSGEFTGALRAFEGANYWWTRFGISPAERTRIKIPGIKPDNAFSAYMRRKVGLRIEDGR